MDDNDSSEHATGLHVWLGDISDLTNEKFWELFRRYGAIHFPRALNSNDEFAAFTERFGREWLPYQLGGRDSVNEKQKIQTVNTGLFGIAPHSELCHQPGQPEIAWLYCDRPPASDGETTLYDGVALAAGFPDSVRRFFKNRKLLYPRRMPMEQALSYYDVSSKNELETFIRERGWQEWLSIEGEELVQAFTVRVFPKLAASGKEVFVNQIVHNSNHTHWHAKLRLSSQTSSVAKALLAIADRMVPWRWRRTARGEGVGYSPMLDDGSLIPSRIVQRISDHVQGHEVAVKWERGDVLVFDNERYMHGRRNVTDPNRRILTRFGNCRRNETAAVA